MSSPDRLANLHRQRALISQHLAWLDAEIASLTPGIERPPAALDHPPVLPVVAQPLETAVKPGPDTSDALALANARADEIISRYRTDEALNPSDAKRSCLLLTAAVVLFGTAIIIGIYLLRYR